MIHYLTLKATIAIRMDNGIDTTEIAVVLILRKNRRITIIATIVPKAAFLPWYKGNLQWV